MQSQFALADYDKTTAFIQAHSAQRPSIGLILGSGLNVLADQVEKPDILPYEEIPNFPVSTVPGHAGRLVMGRLAGAPVCVMQGRFHFYEGYSMQQITFPVRVMKRLGIDTLILTNAAGGINPEYSVGDLMLIEDHINLVGMAGHNPLSGPNLDSFGTRFPATNRVYTRQLRQVTESVAAQQGLSLRRGVYAAVAGPNFESPAEIRMLHLLGADTVGMSTVHEALVARHAGMKVLAISTVTNMTVDTLDAENEPSHEEVNAAGALIVPRFSTLLLGLLARLREGIQG